MNLVFSGRAWEHYLHWQHTERQVLKKLNRLIEECLRTPFSGAGKPEPLKGEFSAWWSRRIDGEHRLIYRIADGNLEIAQCRYHYDK